MYPFTSTHSRASLDVDAIWMSEKSKLCQTACAYISYRAGTGCYGAEQYNKPQDGKGFRDIGVSVYRGVLDSEVRFYVHGDCFWGMLGPRGCVRMIYVATCTSRPPRDYFTRNGMGIYVQISLVHRGLGGPELTNGIGT